jgi:hypothetical protein
MNRAGLIRVVSFFLAATSAAWAQEARATMSGRVVDPQNGVVPQAEVVVRSDDTAVAQTTRTNEQGNWTVRFLIPGNYSFRITARGFEQVERHGIVLETADQKQFDTQLEIGSTSTQVEVTGAAPLIDTTAAISGTVITRKEIEEMPSMSRIATVLATMSPGVIQLDQNQNVAHLWSHDAASQISSEGGDTKAGTGATNNNGTTVYRSNDYQLDGMPNIKSGGQVAFLPAPDAIQEFRVVMNAYDASIGRQAGSTIQMTTKSGTADFHGSLYEYNQNNILNANLFQTNLIGDAKPPVHYNEYGGTIGGPVWSPRAYKVKEKTFFFFNFDGIRNQDPRFQILSVPTELERAGNFSQSFTTQVVGGQRIKVPIQVYDPFSIDSKGVRTLFQNMTIPRPMLSTVARNILKYIPLPNAPNDGTSTDANDFVPHSTRQNKMADITARGDQTWNNSNKTFATVRWYHEDELTDDYFGNAFTGAFGHRIAKGVGVDHVWTFSPNKMLDLKANLTRYEEPANDHGVGFEASTLGFPNSFTSQQAVAAAPRISASGGFVGSGTDVGVNQAGSVTNTSDYTWSAVVTQVKGNMTLRYGAEYWILQQANKGLGNQGRFDFSSEWTRQQNAVGGGTGNGSTLASFLLGLPHNNSNSNFQRNADAFWSQHFTAFYVQDDWRLTRKLTVNAGLRWDLETSVTERYDRATAFYDMAAVNPITSLAQPAWANIVAGNPDSSAVQMLAQLLPPPSLAVLGAQQFNGVNGAPRGVSNPVYDQFQPRLGFAYNLSPNTVIRGGFGRFSQASFITAGQNGFSRTTLLAATQDNYLTPYDTLDNPFRNGILSPTGSSLGPLTNLGQTANWTNPDAGRPYSWQYSVHLQRQRKDWLLEAGYTHNKTYDMPMDANRNLPAFALWQRFRAPLFDSTGRPADLLTWDLQVPNPFQGLAGVTGTLATNQQMPFNQLLNPVSILGTITENNNPTGRNQYDALVAKAEHRFAKGFSMITAFTWSKLMEDFSYLGPEIAGRKIEHRLGGEDRPFHLSVAPVWEIPVGRGQQLWSRMPKAVEAFLGGWQVSGQYLVQSGAPVTFNASDSFFFSGKDFALSADKRTLAQWFDTSQFYRFPDKTTDLATLAAYPAWAGVQNLPGYSYKPAANDTIKNGVYQDFGTYVRTIPTRWSDVRASRVNNLDAVISKVFVVRERVRIQYRFEVYNALNHVRFPAPNADPTSSNFGKVNPTEENNARLVQMALKLFI